MGNTSSFLGRNKKRRVVKPASISNNLNTILPHSRSNHFNVIQESVVVKPPISPENRNFKEELEVFPEAVWKRILENITDPNDISALRNTSFYFNKKMKEITKKGQFSLALPYIMKSGFLDLKSTLKCRLLNTATNAEVEKTFSQMNKATKPHVLNKNSSASSNNPYFFDDVEKLEKFIEHFKECPILSGNPFITNDLKIRAVNTEVYERAMDVLARFGHLVKTLNFQISYTSFPTTIISGLIRALKQVGNLERLSFSFNPDSDGALKNLENLTVAASEFPILPHLVEMELIEVNRNSHPDSSKRVIRSIVKAYGRQLTQLKCGDEMLGSRIPEGFISSHFNNLARLTLSGFERSEDNFNALGALSKVKMPNLQSLTLEFMEGVDGITTIVPATLVKALNNLRNSLEELHFWHRGDGRLFQFMGTLPDPAIQILPKLKRLSVEPPDLYSNLWNLVTAQLRNLQYLELRARRYSGIVGIIHHLPEPRLIQNYFIRFPLLRSFVWKDLMDDCIRKTVIRRRDARREEKTETIERIPYIK